MTHADLDRVIITEWVFLLTKFDDLLGQEDGINLLLRCFHDSRGWGNGVLEYWGDACSKQHFSAHYSVTPSLQYSSFLSGHHADLRLDVRRRDDMSLEVHLIRVKTEGQTNELRQVENRQINLLSRLCLCPGLVSVPL